ncbi:metal-dependent hydrolase [Halococcus sp. IIIV-5B]|uniref:metal-dependent hydrolase n=1 Tax=Halococcus sp. IIIV-5B TaxID=2321230 RepID=UPI000E728FA4|nr:metal-dependent hydrolase [Halococcus sp. IIIV-5B]RJT06831.1 hypothetical protein D3261_04800 [Halococcus sp. IIIV-5B]
MFVGHAALAFALVAGGARLFGCSRGRALALGAAAGAFATVPDVDILYAPVGILGSSGGLMGAAEGFWSASTLVHRAVTHSLVVGCVAAFAVWCWSRAGGLSADRARSEHAVSVTVLAGLVAVATLVSGALGGFVMGVFALAGLVVTEATMRYGGLAPRALTVAALVGLLSHPFGDFLTGEPPAMLYPFDVTLVAHRVGFTADPTLNLLGAFWVEVATLWLAVSVYCWLTRRSVRRAVHGRAALGFAYAAAVLAVPAPTIDSAHTFVFSVLAVGVVGPAPLASRLPAISNRRSTGVGRNDDGRLAAVVTGLAAVTLASIAYAVGYLVT